MTVPVIFDHTLRQKRTARKKPHAFLAAQLAERAFERIDALSDAPSTISVHGGGNPVFIARVQARFPGSAIHTVQVEDSEKLVLPEPVDLFVDLNGAAMVNDLPGFLIQARASLKPGGKFLSLVYGGESLGHLRTALLQAESALRGGAAGRIHPMLNLENAIALLQRAQFQNPVADREFLNLTYAGLSDLARDLREAAMANSLAGRERRTPPRALFESTEQILKKGEARFPVTFEIITMTGWKNA